MAFSHILGGTTFNEASFEGNAYATEATGFAKALEKVVEHVANAYRGTSTTSNAVGSGSKTWTVTNSNSQIPAFAVGMPVRVARTSAPTTTYMQGEITAFNASTGSTTVNVTSSLGSGTHTDWTIAIGGNQTTAPLGVAAGGTGAGTHSANAVLVGAGTGAVTSVAPGSSGNVLTSNGTVWQSAAASTAFDPDGAVTINDSGADVDFRVESDDNANMLFVDGGNDRVGIGTNSPSATTLHSYTSTNDGTMIHESTGGNAVFQITGNRSSDTDVATISLYNAAGTAAIGSVVAKRKDANNSGEMVFSTAAAGSMTEALKIQNDQTVRTTQAGANKFGLRVISNHSSTPIGAQISFGGGAPDDGDQYFLQCVDTTATRLWILSTGSITNHDNSYGSISDFRIKTNIRDANSQWNDIKALRIRNFVKKDDARKYGEDAWEQLGLIAQELEEVSPKLIAHHEPGVCDILSDSAFGSLYTANDPETQATPWRDGDDLPDGVEIGDIKTPATARIGEIKEIKDQVKSINYSVLYMKAVGALQEAILRIEALEAKVEALEA